MKFPDDFEQWRRDHPLLFVLDADRNPVPEFDTLEWGRWIEENHHKPGTGLVAYSAVTPEVRVSTIFLGTNMNFSPAGPPLLFETMIFGGPLDHEQDRYSTWQEAETGHAYWVRMCETMLQGERDSARDTR